MAGGALLRHLVEEPGDLARSAGPLLRQMCRPVAGLKALQGVQNRAQLCIAGRERGMHGTPLWHTQDKEAL
jgi:hypothetical protein